MISRRQFTIGVVAVGAASTVPALPVQASPVFIGLDMGSGADFTAVCLIDLRTRQLKIISDCFCISPEMLGSIYGGRA